MNGPESEAEYAAFDQIGDDDDYVARFWVNDVGGYDVFIKVIYSNTHMVENENWVGIVDEQAGGMIAYAHPSVADMLADLLNKGEEA